MTSNCLENAEDSVRVLDRIESSNGSPTTDGEKEALREFVMSKQAPDDCASEQPKDAEETSSSVHGSTENISEVLSTFNQQLNDATILPKSSKTKESRQNSAKRESGYVSSRPSNESNSEMEDFVQVGAKEREKGSPPSLSSTSGLFVKNIDDSKSCSESSGLTNVEGSCSDIPNRDAASRQNPSESARQQVINHLNSAELNSKLKQIDDLIQHVTDPTFGTSPPSIEDGLKTEEEIQETEDTKRSIGELSNRKSKQREFEDWEELQVLTKKPKIIKIADRRVSETNEPQDVREQFRLAYEEANQDLPPGQSQKKKEFSFDKLMTNNLDKAKEHFDEIADRILAAMTLSGQFLLRDLNSKEGTVNSSEFEDGQGTSGLKSAGVQCNLSSASACSSPRLRASLSQNSDTVLENSSTKRSVSSRRNDNISTVVIRILTRMKNLIGYLWFSVFYLMAVFVARLFDVQDALEACCDYERSRSLKNKENAKRNGH